MELLEQVKKQTELLRILISPDPLTNLEIQKYYQKSIDLIVCNKE